MAQPAAPPAVEAAGPLAPLRFRFAPPGGATWPRGFRPPAGTRLGQAIVEAHDEAYLDTAALDLLRRGLACVASLHAAGGELRLLDLAGQSAEVLAGSGIGPDSRSWPDDARSRLAALTGSGRRLRPLVGLSVTRCRLPLAAPGDASAESPELAELWIEHAAVRLPPRRGSGGAGELAGWAGRAEVWPLAASEAQWRKLGGSLAKRAALKAEGGDPLRRALRMAAEHRAGEAPPAQGLDAAMGLAGAALQVLRRQVLDLAMAEAALRRAPGAEAVRRMRVAARRLRGTLAIWGPALPRSARSDGVARGLRGLRRALGAVRDRDVALERLAGLRGRLDADGAERLTPIVAVWAAERDVEAARLAAFLEGRPHARTLARLLRAAGGLAQRRPARRRGTLAAGAWALLAPAWEGLEHGLASLDGRDLTDDAAVPAPELHELRILGKALRDGLRPLRGLLDEAGRAALAEVEALVDGLGRVQGLASTAQLLASAGEAAEAGEDYAAALAADERAERARIPGLVAPVVAQGFATRLRSGLAS